MKCACLALLVVASTVICAEFQSLTRPGTHLQQRSRCGVRKVTTQPLIVVGTETIPGEWPWHAAVYHVDKENASKEYKCGGALIHPKHVLTTASCGLDGTGKSIASIVVQLGQFNLVESATHAKEVKVNNVFIHEKYIAGKTPNNVAVLRLKKNVQYTDYIQPACLPKVADNIENFNGKTGTIVGWGFVEARKLADKLQSAQVPVIDFFGCLQSDRDFFAQHLYQGVFCAGLKNGTAPCFGDAGGGMYFKSKNVWYLRGLISFTDRVYTETGGCNTQQYFGLVDVVYFLEWIQEKIKYTPGQQASSSVAPPV